MAINQSKSFSSPSPSPNMGYSRTSTPVSNRSSSSNQFNSTYSPSNLTDWGVSENNESWEFNSPMTPVSHRASPFAGSGRRTPIRQSPNLQSPSVDSYQSRSPSNESNFLKPYPPSDKVDNDTLLSPGSSQLHRGKHDDRKNFPRNISKTEISPSKPKNDNVKCMDKGTTVDANIFQASVPLLPYQSQKEHRFWPGEDCRPFGDTNSSPNPTSPFVPINPAFSYGSNYSFGVPDPYPFGAQQFNAASPDLSRQFVKNDEKYSPSPSPLNNYQVRGILFFPHSSIFSSESLLIAFVFIVS